jgi:hypothetical protein
MPSKYIFERKRAHCHRVSGHSPSIQIPWHYHEYEAQSKDPGHSQRYHGTVKGIRVQEQVPGTVNGKAQSRIPGHSHRYLGTVTATWTHVLGTVPGTVKSTRDSKKLGPVMGKQDSVTDTRSAITILR